MKLGDTYQTQIRYTQTEVIAFANLTGDHNPIHLDADYAAQTAFRKPIIHGMLAASVFSKILGTTFPGEGTIYLQQSLTFKRAMYVDTDYQVKCEVISVDERRGMASIQTHIYEQETEKLVLEGEASIINKKALRNRS